MAIVLIHFCLFKQGSLETKEFILDEVAKGLNLNPNRFCVLAALLGNFLLTDADLREFHKRVCEENKTSLVMFPKTVCLSMLLIIF